MNLQTGSVTDFVILSFLTEVPSLFLSPIAGLVVDRYSRKRVMIISDTIAALSTFIIACLIWSNHIELWHIFIANCISSSMAAFQWPAFQASIILLVPKKYQSKMEGANQLAPALSMMIAPAIGGAVIYSYHLEGIVFIELITFILSILAMIKVHIPPPLESDIGKKSKEQFLQEIKAGWDFCKNKSGFVALLWFLGQSHFCSGIVQVLMTPLILSFTTSSMLGNVLTMSGTGGIFGALALSIWGTPKRGALGFLFVGAIQGLLLGAVGIQPKEYTILAVAFCYMFFIPTVRASRDSVIRKQVPQDLQGRVFALGHIITKIALPLAATCAGPLADIYFEPWMASDEAFLGSSIIGHWLGTGKGRGVALLFVVVGVINTTFCMAGLLYRPLRQIDLEENYKLKSK